MRLKKRFTFKLSERDREMLDRLAAKEAECASELIRRLVRLEAQRRGVWFSSTNGERQHNTEEVAL
jgi:hypothetical protein